ncbi:MAG: hypothetical protein QM428_06250 [Verrucomicrobiota bacterium]|jgi:hypothetical protein|nr:hypothetical protein [Verrucomicrobiota bacterium]
MQKAAESCSTSTCPLRKPCLILCGVLLLGVLALAGWYQLENMGGRKAWQRYARQADGWVDSVDSEDFAIPTSPERNYIWMKDVIPPPLADGENFAAHPYWQWQFTAASHPGGEYELARELSGEEKSQAERWIAFSAGAPKTSSGWAPSMEELRRADLAKFFNGGSGASGETAETAPTLEETLKLWDERLKPNQPLYEELRQYLKERPQCRYPIQYRQDNHGLFLNPLLPHLGALKGLAHYSMAFACIHLARGETEQAQEDILYMLDIADTLQREPFPISLRIRMNISEMALSVLWEGLEAGAWQAGQLRRFQERLGKVSFWNDLKLRLMGTRAAHNEELVGDLRWMEVLIHQVYGSPETSPGLEGRFKALKTRLRPIGWYYRELLEFNLMMDSMLNIFDDADRRYKPTELTETFKTLDYYTHPDLGAPHARLIRATESVYNLEESFLNAAYHQFLVQAAEVACALERYRLENERYPASLEALAERLPVEELPCDWVSALPPRIKLTDTGYLLWAPGWDRVDDGGVRAPASLPAAKGDWVWEIRR